MIYSDLHFCLQAWRAFIALEMHWSSSLGARPEFSHLFTASSKVWKNIHFEISSCKLFHCTIQFVWESTINNLSASIVARIGLARIKTVSPGDRSLYQLWIHLCLLFWVHNVMLTYVKFTFNSEFSRKINLILAEPFRSKRRNLSYSVSCFHIVEHLQRESGCIFGHNLKKLKNFKQRKSFLNHRIL